MDRSRRRFAYGRSRRSRDNAVAVRSRSSRLSRRLFGGRRYGRRLPRLFVPRVVYRAPPTPIPSSYDDIPDDFYGNDDELNEAADWYDNIVAPFDETSYIASPVSVNVNW